VAIVDAASPLVLFDDVNAGQRIRQYRADVGFNTVIADVQVSLADHSCRHMIRITKLNPHRVTTAMIESINQPVNPLTVVTDGANVATLP